MKPRYIFIPIVTQGYYFFIIGITYDSTGDVIATQRTILTALSSGGTAVDNDYVKCVFSSSGSVQTIKQDCVRADSSGLPVSLTAPTTDSLTPNQMDGTFQSVYIFW